jgi:quercetin dioxygenase-like cupin family protein
LYVGKQTVSQQTGKTMSDESVLRNLPDLNWKKMLPELGEHSPVYSILRLDLKSDATTLLIEFPTAIHIPKHTHEKSETHFLLEGSHLFENNQTGERFEVRKGGYFYLPGKVMHEAWVPAGAKAIIILESGWKVDWQNGPPTSNDLGLSAPTT